MAIFFSFENSISEYQSILTFLGLSALVCAGIFTAGRNGRLATVPVLSFTKMPTTMTNDTDDWGHDNGLAKTLPEERLEDAAPQHPDGPPAGSPESSAESDPQGPGIDNVVVEHTVLPTPTTLDTLVSASQTQAPKAQVGLLVNEELEQALKECKEKVERIAKEYRAANKKFR
jgi:hypothetical protein